MKTQRENVAAVGEQIRFITRLLHNEDHNLQGNECNLCSPFSLSNDV